MSSYSIISRAFLSSYSIISLDESCNNLDSVSISFLKVAFTQEMKKHNAITADHGHGFEQFADYVIQFQEPEKTIQLLNVVTNCFLRFIRDALQSEP